MYVIGFVVTEHVISAWGLKHTHRETTKHAYSCHKINMQRETRLADLLTDTQESSHYTVCMYVQCIRVISI